MSRYTYKKMLKGAFDKQHKSGLSYVFREYEIYASDNGGWIYAEITKADDIGVGVTFELEWDVSNFEFEWEADGEPTYVPYGSTSVMYDDGRGGLSSVTTYADVEKHMFSEYDDPEVEIIEEKVLEILECSKEELKELLFDMMSTAEQIAAEELEEYYEDSDNWPERDDW